MSRGPEQAEHGVCGGESQLASPGERLTAGVVGARLNVESLSVGGGLAIQAHKPVAFR